MDRSDFDLSEQIAAIACVLAVLTEESVKLDGQGSKAVTESNWLRQGRLESASFDPYRAPPLGSVWRSSVSLIALVLLAFAFAELPASAGVDGGQEMDGGTSRLASIDFPRSTQYNDVTLKVALSTSANAVEIKALDGADIKDLCSGKTVASLVPQSDWSVRLGAGGNLSFSAHPAANTGAVIGSGPSPGGIRNVAYTPRAIPSVSRFMLPAQTAASGGNAGYVVVPSPNEGKNQVLAVNGRLYRGSLWLRPSQSFVNGRADTTGISAINLVNLEDYLLSVLPSEMPSGWPPEALKAQAIAARSYAVANIGKHAKDGYDLKATVEDQVYAGIGAEHETSNRAVAETTGIVIKHDGKPVSAFFHSTSGGCTEVAENVWGRQVPYLKNVVDYDDASPHFSWLRKFSTADIEKALGADYGQILSIFVVSRTASLRVKELLVVGTNRSHFLSGEAMRHAFKLPSSNFNVGYKETGYEFAGRGNGHGLGMSQYGARTLASAGYNAAQILAYYYKDVAIEYVEPSPGL